MLSLGRRKFYVRKGDVTDAEWLAELLCDMFREGHLANNELASRAGSILAGRTIGVRSNGKVVDRLYHVWIGEVRQTFRLVPVAAAIVTVAHNENSSSPSPARKSEIWVFGIGKRYRGRGYGGSFLRSLMDRYDDPGVFVRCAPQTEAFARLARRLGFTETTRQATGVRLEWQQR